MNMTTAVSHWTPNFLSKPDIAVARLSSDARIRPMPISGGHFSSPTRFVVTNSRRAQTKYHKAGSLWVVHRGRAGVGEIRQGWGDGVVVGTAARG